MIEDKIKNILWQSLQQTQIIEDQAKKIKELEKEIESLKSKKGKKSA